MDGDPRRGRRAAALLLGALVAPGCTPDAPPPPPPDGPTVARHLTTGDGKHLLDRLPDGRLSSAASAGVVIAVDDGVEMQEMVGFGASLTDSSAWLIDTQLDEEARARLMAELFDPATGLGLSLLRQPMGASDFTTSGSYSYDDLPPGQADDDLIRFSIAHDEEHLLPLLRRAREIHPALSVIALPWSPPAWMKASGTMNGGAIDPRRFPALARYFVRFVEEYAAAGVPVVALAPQNEPLHSTADYPTALLPAAEEAVFVGRHLGPALAAAGRSGVALLGYEHNWDQPGYPLALLDDAEAAPFLAGTSFHCYAGHESAQDEVHLAHPDKDIWFTECSGTVGSDFAGDLAWNVEHLAIGAPRHWARSVALWNLVLDQGSGPKNGGCRNCRALVTLDRSTTPPTLTRNVEYYVLGHLSRFVRPGARRIESTSLGPGGIQTVAFRNPEGTIALVVLNGSRTARAFTVAWRGLSLAADLDAGAVTTLVWDGR